MRAPTRLVKIEKDVKLDGTVVEWLYRVYDGRQHLRGFAYSIPLSAYWVEELRRDPTQFDTPPEAA